MGFSLKCPDCDRRYRFRQQPKRSTITCRDCGTEISTRLPTTLKRRKAGAKRTARTQSNVNSREDSEQPRLRGINDWETRVFALAALIVTFQAGKLLSRADSLTSIGALVRTVPMGIGVALVVAGAVLIYRRSGPGIQLLYAGASAVIVALVVIFIDRLVGASLARLPSSIINLVSKSAVPVALIACLRMPGRNDPAPDKFSPSRLMESIWEHYFDPESGGENAQPDRSTRPGQEPQRSGNIPRRRAPKLN